MNRQIGFLLASAILIGLIAWYMDDYREFSVDTLLLSESTTDEEANQQVNTYIVGLTRWQFNEEGLLTNEIKANQAKQYLNQNNTLYVSSPEFIFGFHENSWHATANSAVVLLDKEQSTLSQNVIFTQNNSLISIYTDALIVDNAERNAHTTAKVRIIEPQSQTHATGMQLNLNTEHLQLNHHVNTTFYPVTP